MICDDMWWLVMRIYENWWVTVCGSRCISKRCSKSRWARWASAVHMRCMACCVIFSVPGAELGAYLKVQSRCVPMFHPSPLYRLRGKKLWLRLVLLQFISVQTASLQENKHWNPSTSFLWIQFANYYMRHTYDIFWYIILYIYNTGACDWRMMHN